MTQYQYEGQNRFLSAYRGAQEMDQARARMTAGNALAGGNTQGAMAALGGIGDLQSVQALQQGQQRQQQQMMEQEQASEEEARTFMLQGAQALSMFPTPEEAEAAWRENLRPVLQQMGMNEAMLQRIDMTPKTRQNLNSFITALGGEVQSPYANDVTVGRARIRPDPNTGVYSPVYEAPVDPLDEAYRQAQIDAMRAQEDQRRAAADRARRPAAGRGGGAGGGGGRGNSGGGSRAAPAAINPSGVRWD